MGLKEEFEIAHYEFPAYITLHYDGNEISDADIAIQLTNADGDHVRFATQAMPLSPTQKANLKTVLENRIAALESSTGWTEVGS